MTKDELRDLIEDKVNEIYAEYQKSEGIISGDIYPEEALKLEELQNKLADIVVDSMKDNERINNFDNFLKHNDKELHDIYAMRSLNYYDSKDAKDGTVDLSVSFYNWANDWYYELYESFKTLDQMHEEVLDVLKEYKELTARKLELNKSDREWDREWEAWISLYVNFYDDNESHAENAFMSSHFSSASEIHEDNLRTIKRLLEGNIFYKDLKEMLPSYLDECYRELDNRGLADKIKLLESVKEKRSSEEYER